MLALALAEHHPGDDEQNKSAQNSQPQWAQIETTHPAPAKQRADVAADEGAAYAQEDRNQAAPGVTARVDEPGDRSGD